MDGQTDGKNRQKMNGHTDGKIDRRWIDRQIKTDKR